MIRAQTGERPNDALCRENRLACLALAQSSWPRSNSLPTFERWPVFEIFFPSEGARTDEQTHCVAVFSIPAAFGVRLCLLLPRLLSRPSFATQQPRTMYLARAEGGERIQRDRGPRDLTRACISRTIHLWKKPRQLRWKAKGWKEAGEKIDRRCDGFDWRSQSIMPSLFSAVHLSLQFLVGYGCYAESTSSVELPISYNKTDR